MGVAAVAGGPTSQGPWLVVHRRGRVERGAARRGTHDFGAGGLPRFGQGAVAASGVRRSGRRLAANLAGSREASELGFAERLAAPLATTLVAGGHRLAPGPVLRSAAPKPQRDLLRQAAPGHHEISCLCHGVHRAVWATLHDRVDMGATPRIDGHGLAAPAGADPRTWPENQAFVAGSRLLQRPRHGIPATAESPLLDARGVPRPSVQEETRHDRSALDQTPKRWLVCTHFEERQTPGNAQGLRGLSHPPQSQRQKTGTTEAALRCLAGAWFADRDPRGLPQALWHRIELSPIAAGTHLHLHAKPAPAAGVCSPWPDPEKPVGMDSRDALGAWPRIGADAPSPTVAFP